MIETLFLLPRSYPAFVSLNTIDRGMRATTKSSGDKLFPREIPLLITTGQCLSFCC